MQIIWLLHRSVLPVEESHLLSNGVRAASSACRFTANRTSGGGREAEEVGGVTADGDGTGAAATRVCGRLGRGSGREPQRGQRIGEEGGNALA